MASVEGLDIPDHKKQYITKVLNPILEDLVAACIVETPDNTPQYMVEWLVEKFGVSAPGGSGSTNTGALLEALGAGKEDEDESEEEESDDDVDELPDNFVMRSGGARQSVSAAAYGAWNQKKAFTAPVHYKDEATKAKVRELLSTSFMFKALEDKDMATVVDATEPVSLGANERVIQQGDDGDFMFIIMEGQLDCLKKFAGESEEKLVKTCERGDCFGELALLYNCPRAASVQSRGPCELLKLDRETFTNIVSDAARNKRERYDEFLQKVPLLKGVDSYERSQIADALATESHSNGAVIVKQGDPGDKFYIIEDGSGKATKGSGSDEREVMQYQAGDYFGELALLRNEPRAANVIATSDCKVLVLDRRSFKRLLGPLDAILQRGVEQYK
eukprot:CAMPEP_0204304768 /NCGR_PEP_ID=MMETSP0468-20130131/84583_1 /ASSEMBLY_ACC=CAM_ASM_000383 /TAXON_ID=2969 /ORGANISM="Oxyrrhis marina" /LENGTH=388 /DNA_ID=CAMNT_0051284099 /DNA_START=842 /DNA_END=2008 /DNA_ORIENTATION=-